MKKKNQQKGVTLIEMLVVTAIFLILIEAILGVFISNVRVQRRILKTQEQLDQLSYALDYMSRTLRMAKKDSTGKCLSMTGKNYYIQFDESDQPSIIQFLNSEGHCQQFKLNNFEIALRTSSDNDQANLGGAQPLTSKSSFRVTSQRFNLIGDDDNSQPRVTIFLEAEISEGKKITLQTSISQRDIKK